MRVLCLILVACTAVHAQDTRAKALADDSRKVLRQDATLALLLAREAMAAADTEPARTALYAALVHSHERAILRHDAAVVFVDFSPDGKTLATASDDGTARIWTTAGEARAVLRPGGPVKEVRFLGGADRVLTRTEKLLTFWDGEGGKLEEVPVIEHVFTGSGVLLFPQPDAIVYRNRNGAEAKQTDVAHAGVGAGVVAFYTIRADGRVTLYDARGREKHLRAEKSTTRVVFGSTGEVLATFGGGSLVELWSHKGKRLAVLKHGGAVDSVSIGATAGRVMTAAADNSYGLWDFSGKRLAERTRLGDTATVVMSEKGYFNAALEGNRKVIIFDERGDDFATWKANKPIRRVVPDHIGMGYVFEYEDGTNSYHAVDCTEVKAEHLLRGKRTVCQWARNWLLLADDKGRVGLQHWYGAPYYYLDGHRAKVRHARWSPDERFVLSASEDGTARLWEVEPPEMPVFHHEGRVGGVQLFEKNRRKPRLITQHGGTLAFRELSGKVLAELKFGNFVDWIGVGGERVVAAVRDDPKAWLYDLDGELVAELPHPEPVRGVSITEKGDRILTFSTQDTKARLWSRRGRLQKELEHPSAVVYGQILPDDRHLLTVASDERARVWSMAGRVQAEWPVGARPEYCVVDGKNARVMAIPESDPTVNVWNLKGERLATLTGHTARVWAGDLNTTSGLLLTASADKTARLWDADGKPRKVLPHPGEVFMCGFLHGERGFITTCKDGSVRHWDNEGRLLAVLKGHLGEVHRFAHTADGTAIYTASYDTTVRRWPLEPDVLLAIAAQRLCRDFTPEERKKYAALLGK